jgi:hypothetical protein
MFQMATNKMEVVAQLFGKELGESFAVKNKYCSCKDMIFDGSGLRISKSFKRNDKITTFETELLRELLTGEAVIVDE